MGPDELSETSLLHSTEITKFLSYILLIMMLVYVKTLSIIINNDLARLDENEFLAQLNELCYFF